MKVGDLVKYHGTLRDIHAAGGIGVVVRLCSVDLHGVEVVDVDVVDVMWSPNLTQRSRVAYLELMNESR